MYGTSTTTMRYPGMLQTLILKITLQSQPFHNAPQHQGHPGTSDPQETSLSPSLQQPILCISAPKHLPVQAPVAPPVRELHELHASPQLVTFLGRGPILAVKLLGGAQVRLCRLNAAEERERWHLLGGFWCSRLQK